MKTPISFRLRKDVDADLILALDGIEQKKLTELCRNGLRLILGIQTTRQMQIVERPIQAEAVTIKGATVRIGSGQAKPYVPTKEGRG